LFWQISFRRHLLVGWVVMPLLSCVDKRGTHVHATGICLLQLLNREPPVGKHRHGGELALLRMLLLVWPSSACRHLVNWLDADADFQFVGSLDTHLHEMLASACVRMLLAAVPQVPWAAAALSLIPCRTNLAN
jgi:hypothetical protein